MASYFFQSMNRWHSDGNMSKLVITNVQLKIGHQIEIIFTLNFNIILFPILLPIFVFLLSAYSLASDY